MSKWESFINRVKQETTYDVLKNNKSGFAIVSAHVLVDHNGNPVAWVVDKARRIEPSTGIAEIIKAVAGSLD